MSGMENILFQYCINYQHIKSTCSFQQPHRSKATQIQWIYCSNIIQRSLWGKKLNLNTCNGFTCKGPGLVTPVDPQRSPCPLQQIIFNLKIRSCSINNCCNTPLLPSRFHLETPIPSSTWLAGKEGLKFVEKLLRKCFYKEPLRVI